MNVPIRLAAYAAVLGVAFGGAALAGAAIDPTDEKPVAATSGSHHGGSSAHSDTGHVGAAPAMQGDAHAGNGAMGANGLAVSTDGLTLEADRTRFAVGKPARLRFRVTDDRGRVLRDEYQLESARRMHFIVVRRDTAIYQHLHPTEAPDGTWSVDVTLPEAGVYRAYADFQIGGVKHVLATDLFAPGSFAPNVLPAAADTGQARLDETQQASGEQITVRAPGLTAGKETMLTFAVTHDGRPVSDLQPYLGAKGHLVALREGDLAYLHVHPDEAKVASDEIQFMSTFPTAGRYRPFLQFRRGQKVRTVAYTLEVPR